MKLQIFFDNLKWTNKKNFNELLESWRFNFFKKNKKIIWSLKQLP